MFSTVAFSELIAAAATEEYVAAITDQSQKVSGDDLYIGKLNKLVGIYAFGSGLTDARLSSPSLRKISTLYINPLVNDQGGYAPYTTRVFDYRGESPLSLEENEALNAQATCAMVDATLDNLIGVWLADAALAPVVGEIYTVKMSHAVTALNEAWTYTELTTVDDLPVGRYAIVGARCYMGGGGLFRFVFVGESHRPGGICVHETHLQEDFIFRMGHMGVWGEFDSVNPPGLEVISQKVAHDAGGVYLRVDLIKVT